MWREYSRYDMYSDSSSSTTTSDSEENFPGFIPIPEGGGSLDGQDSFCVGIPMDNSKAKMYQTYKGQIKMSAYINYGLLTVHVMMGRHLKSKWKSPCDSYVKLCLLPDEMKRTRCKTEVIHESNCPLYDEKFSFELLDEDYSKRLFLSVWHRDTSRNQCEFLGCMSFGIQHIKSQSRTVSGWYYLLNGDLGKKKHLQSTQRKGLSHRNRKNIPSVNQDVLWMEPHMVVIKRPSKTGGFGFTISGSCPVGVGRVDSGCPAEKSGLKPGDCIIRIDGLNVSRSTADSVARIIKHATKQIVLEVQRSKKIEKTTNTNTFQLEDLECSPGRTSLCNSVSYDRHIEPLRDEPEEPYWEQENDKPRYQEPENNYGYMQKKPDMRNYGWLDLKDDVILEEPELEEQEDVYMDPEDLIPGIAALPGYQERLSAPVPPTPPARNQPMGKFGVSPWKPGQGGGRSQSTFSLYRDTSQESVYRDSQRPQSRQSMFTDSRQQDNVHKLSRQQSHERVYRDSRQQSHQIDSRQQSHQIDSRQQSHQIDSRQQSNQIDSRQLSHQVVYRDPRQQSYQAVHRDPEPQSHQVIYRDSRQQSHQMVQNDPRQRSHQPVYRDSRQQSNEILYREQRRHTKEYQPHRVSYQDSNDDEPSMNSHDNTYQELSQDIDEPPQKAPKENQENVDPIMDKEQEWDYFDTPTRINNYGWIDNADCSGPYELERSYEKIGLGGSSGYSSSTLPRSMKFGKGKHAKKPVGALDTGAHGSRSNSSQEDDLYLPLMGASTNISQQSSQQSSHYSSQQSSHYSSQQSMPMRKQVSFKEFI